LTSEAGPWNDFEIIYPRGVKRKEAKESILIEEQKEEESIILSSPD
jgi:hypothetical protein